MILPEEVCESIKFVAAYAGDTVDWLKIKKEIIKNLKPNHRSLFSTRDPITKKQIPNQFDIEAAKFWEKITGKILTLKQDGNETRITS